MTCRCLLPLVLLGWLSVPVFGQAGVIGRVAATLLELEHTCTSAQGLMLESLIRSGEASRAERTVASAVLRILHTPHPDDIPKLRRIAADQELPADVRTLAEIVQRFVHVARGADRATLQRIANQRSAGEVASPPMPERQFTGPPTARRFST